MHYVLIKVFVVADSSDDQLQKTAEVIMNMPVHGSSIRRWAVAAWPDIRTSTTETVMNSYTNWRILGLFGPAPSGSGSCPVAHHGVEPGKAAQLAPETRGRFSFKIFGKMTL
jgi:hypothetical protein